MLGSPVFWVSGLCFPDKISRSCVPRFVEHQCVMVSLFWVLVFGVPAKIDLPPAFNVANLHITIARNDFEEGIALLLNRQNA